MEPGETRQQGKTSRWQRSAAASLGALLLLGCSSSDEPAPLPDPGPGPEPLRIASMIHSNPEQDPSGYGELPNLQWALENINVTGVAGRTIEIDYYEAKGVDLAALGEQIAQDDRYVAAIAPPGSQGLAQVASAFLTHRKPIVSTTSASDDLLRAYGAKGALWRTRESDIAQVELMLRIARDSGAHRVTLVTSLDVSGSTFFSWFGFFSRELGFLEKDIQILTFTQGEPCNPVMQQAIQGKPELLFLAPGSPEELLCAASSLPPPDQPRPRVLVADTGLDPYALEQLGGSTIGLEGLATFGPEEYEKAFRDRYGDARLAPHGASEYDALLLLAYGLQVSGGKGGDTLIKALQKVVDGREPNDAGWDADGIRSTLSRLEAGEHPALRGATGPLQFEPTLYMDLADSTLAHWLMTPEGLRVDRRYWTGDASFLTSQGAMVPPSAALASAPNLSTWTPTTDRSDTWALVAALSSTWSNYRHQADALQQYQLLRASGVPDDHIVLVLADDLPSSPENKLPGQVRNEPAGSDVRGDVQIDYPLTVTGDDLANILAGHATDRTPTVLHPTASSNVYVYLAGHGGVHGIPLNANSTSAGLSGEGEVFSPSQLRTALCSLRASQSIRRGLVVIESCYSGAFGDATYGGLDQGCDDGTTLDGVLLMTAANSAEVSFAGAYDVQLGEWVNDSFSRRVASRLLGSVSVSVADLYTDTYRQTAGSHPSLFNTAHAGPLTAISLTEFFAP